MFPLHKPINKLTKSENNFERWNFASLLCHSHFGLNKNLSVLKTRSSQKRYQYILRPYQESTVHTYTLCAFSRTVVGFTQTNFHGSWYLPSTYGVQCNLQLRSTSKGSCRSSRLRIHGVPEPFSFHRWVCVSSFFLRSQFLPFLFWLFAWSSRRPDDLARAALCPREVTVPFLNTRASVDRTFLVRRSQPPFPWHKVIILCKWRWKREGGLGQKCRA